MTTMDEKLAEFRRRYVERVAAAWDYHFGFALEQRGVISPIELLLLAALLDRGWEFPTSPEDGTRHFRLDQRGIDGPHDALLCEERQGDANRKALIFAQLPVALEDRSIRVDLAVIAPWGAFFAVELDGHDFHERMKEQATRDKSRDRLLTSSGWSPIRFSGSEVWRDPARCAEEINRLLFASRPQALEWQL